ELIWQAISVGLAICRPGGRCSYIFNKYLSLFGASNIKRFVFLASNKSHAEVSSLGVCLQKFTRSGPIFPCKKRKKRIQETPKFLSGWLVDHVIVWLSRNGAGLELAPFLVLRNRFKLSGLTNHTY